MMMMMSVFYNNRSLLFAVLGAILVAHCVIGWSFTGGGGWNFQVARVQKA